MRKLSMFGLVIAAVVMAAGSRLPAQTKATATNVATIPHEAVPNFFKNPPGIYTGENMGISTDSKGNIYIYHRAGETRLFQYSPTGTFMREIGRGNYGARWVLRICDSAMSEEVGEDPRAQALEWASNLIASHEEWEDEMAVQATETR